MVRPPACDRARTWASLRLDGELSEIESALLAAHLERCPGCREASALVAGATRALRGAAFEAPPAAPVLARSRGSRRSFYAAVASTVAVVGLLTSAGFVGAVYMVAKGATPTKPAHISAVASGMSEDVQLLAHVRVLRIVRPVPGRVLWPA